MRIALAGTLVLAALWLVVLRPKPVDAPPPKSTPAAKADAPASAPGKAAANAQSAVDAANAKTAGGEATANATSEGNAPEVKSSTPAPQAAATPQTSTPSATKPADPTTPAAKPSGTMTVRGKAVHGVLSDMAAKKVVVLLFWDRKGSDDNEVRRAVARVDRHGGQVAVHKAPIGNLADFEPITRGVPVVTSPTVLIIDRAKQARAISGLTVTRELDDKIVKALKVKP